MVDLQQSESMPDEVHVGQSQLVADCLALIRKQWSGVAPVGIVLGSGLGQFVDSIQVESALSFRQLPGFPQPTAVGHAGRLVCGMSGTIPVVVLQGRSHFYEGYRWEQATFPMHVLHGLGVRTLILSCAAGGLAPGMSVGDLLIIEDHLNFNMHRAQVPGWLAATGRAGGSPFCRKLVNQLDHIASAKKIPARRGVYIGVTGPNYETRSEQRMFREWGDAIGMSTIAEAIVAHRLGIQTSGIAMITNLCDPDSPSAASGDHVVEAASRAEFRFRELVTTLVQQLG
ncbi:purine-nucleoside phosphorylase [Planctomicrobium sp. SH527]|uniref:purine-nucleoside phosphorylase n=1 Tax=Planctomicrobium sp. SH527 TaxID=3448123 RepID=UPI003F5B5F8F